MASKAAAKPLDVIEDPETGNRFVIYTTKAGVHMDVYFDGEEPWFSQLQLAEMFGVDVRTVSEHITKFRADGEIGNSVIRDFRITAKDGKSYAVQHYGLDVAFYVGYRVNSAEGKLFRRWATQMLVQLAKYGFVIDKRRLKGSPDRLAKLREIIRELRADEANLYAELRHILAMCKNYDPKLESTRLFFANFQNRLLYAITGHTAAEILLMEADASKPNMGLQTWDEDNEHPLQGDATDSKNYLGDLQLEDLNRLVGMVLDYFEDQTKRSWLVKMEDADAKLEVNKRKMLRGFGNASAEDAEKHAKAQYKVFDKARRAEWKTTALAELNAAAKALPRSRKKTS